MKGTITSRALTRASAMLSWLAVCLVGCLAGMVLSGVTFAAQQDGRGFTTEPRDLIEAITYLQWHRLLPLVEQRQALHVTDDEGNTPLHLAVKRQDWLLVQLLLAYGADPRAVNDAGQTPLQLMRSWDRHSRNLAEVRQNVTDAFIQHELREEPTSARRQAQTRFLMSARLADVELAWAAVADGADPNESPVATGATVLHFNRAPKMVSAYVALGVDLNRRTVHGETPLRAALAKSEVRLVKALLQAGAEITVTEKGSDLSWMLVTHRRNAAEMAQLLLRAGAPVRHQEWMAAIGSRSGDVVGLLVARGGPFDLDSEEWELRLAEAVRRGGESVMTALRTDPLIAAHLEARERRNAGERQEQLNAFQGWLQPHVQVLMSLMGLLALVVAVPARFLTSRVAAYLAWTSIGTAVLMHLFVFTPTIQAGLTEFRFFGERLTSLIYVAYVLFDGAALLTGLGVGALVWAVLPLPSRKWPVLLPAVGILVVTFALMVSHNLGRIGWPAAAYRSLTGYEKNLARKVQKRKHRRAARPAYQEPYLPLMTPIKRNDENALRADLASGADPNTRQRIQRGELTAIMYAAQYGRASMVSMLLGAGADVHAATETGFQAIHATLAVGGVTPPRLEILRMLLDAGADANATTRDGKTALCYTYTMHKPGSLDRRARELLIDNGAELSFSDICTRDLYVKNPAILNKVAAPATELDARRPFPVWEKKNPPLPYRATALWQAAYRRDAEMVRMLLDLGADIEKRDTRRGMTPLQAALDLSRGRPDRGKPVVALLLGRGADPRAVAWDGTTMADLDDNGLVSAWLARRRE